MPTNKPEVVLPELPEPDVIVEHGYGQPRTRAHSDDQLRTYGQACIDTLTRPAAGDFVMVPREPTQAMVAAGNEASDWHIRDADDVYRAMLSAAPQQHGLEVVDDWRDRERLSLLAFRTLLEGFEVSIEAAPLEPPATYLDRVTLTREFQPGGGGPELAKRIAKALSESPRGIAQQPAEAVAGENVTIDGRHPTHYCNQCGALWLSSSEHWSLVSSACGKCCDNAPMGGSIKPLLRWREWPGMGNVLMSQQVEKSLAKPVAWAVKRGEGALDFDGCDLGEPTLAEREELGRNIPGAQFVPLYLAPPPAIDIHQTAEAVAVDLEQFREPMRHWKAHVTRLANDAMRRGYSRDVVEAWENEEQNAGRLLAIIDNALPAIDIGKLRELVKDWRKSEDRAAREAENANEDRDAYAGSCERDAYKDCADELAALIGDGGERTDG